MHLKLDNFHAAYAAIIVAIKNIICAHSKLTTVATNKQSKRRLLISMERIQLRIQYIQTSCSLLFLRRALCHFVVMVRIFGTVTTSFCFDEKNSLLLLIQPDMHLGHLLISDIRRCFIVFFFFNSGICVR